MEYITTYTGENFTPHIPDANQIKLEDIAHSLSLICRANGHFKRFYSVAQHCINCANEAKSRGMSARIQLACLLHDGSEAYISDITRPVKKHLPRYLEIEEALQNTIYKKFLATPLTDEECSLVKQVDNDMLVCEFNALMNKIIYDHVPIINSEPSFNERDYLAVKNMFLRLARNLMNGEKLVTALGIDGCHKGWCVVRLDSVGNSSMRLVQNIDGISAFDADVAIIDIPIGLSDSGEERPFDKMVKERLGNRRNSVFPVPCREAVYESECSYEKACEINKKITGKKISRQSWAIIPKIHEVDLFLRDNPEMRKYLLESHPELCFATLLGKPCEYHKRSQGGEKERIAFLRRHLDIISLFNNLQYSGDGAEARRDDIIDAAVLAVAGFDAIEANNNHLIHNFIKYHHYKRK